MFAVVRAARLVDRVLSVNLGASIAQDEWPEIRAHLDALPIEVDPVSASRTWGAALELANAHGIAVYDAMYLELAARMQLPLATLDRALLRAAQSAGVDRQAID